MLKFNWKPPPEFAWAYKNTPMPKPSFELPEPTKRYPRESYTVAWLSALAIEKAAAIVCLDEIHLDPLEPQPFVDPNSYTYGRIGEHNVVLNILPLGSYGHIATAALTAYMHSTFPSLRCILLAGIAGGVPDYPKTDVRLGDVVVGLGRTSSDSEGPIPAIIHYDFGKVGSEGSLELTGVAVQTPAIFRKVLAEIKKIDPAVLQAQLKASAKSVMAFRKEVKPDVNTDRLFQVDYEHLKEDYDCSECGCDFSKIVSRTPRKTDDIVIHYGPIASGNKVIKYASERERLYQETEALCFEMEAMGLLHSVRFLVVKGICDYSDSHKNDNWQQWAAAVAAAYTKVVISHFPVAVPGQSIFL